MNGNDIKCVS